MCSDPWTPSTLCATRTPTGPQTKIAPSPRGGRDDAGRVAGVLQKAPIGAIFTSPYRRARQTVAPLAERLSLPINEIHDLRERQLSAGYVEDFSAAVEATWRDKAFCHPGGESNAAAQRRGVAIVHRLREQQVADHVVLATHGNLLALVLQHFDPSIDSAFWRSLTMPDIYSLSWTPAGPPEIIRLWQEPGGSQRGFSEEHTESHIPGLTCRLSQPDRRGGTEGQCRNDF
ncbi:histidine phosphatase family protein [Chloroflexota bacterium]